MKPSLFQSYYKKMHEICIFITLRYYETYVLPEQKDRVSLLESKKQEFRLRKKLLHPYENKKIIEEATPEERG